MNQHIHHHAGSAVWRAAFIMAVLAALLLAVPGARARAQSNWRYYDSAESEFRIGAVGLLWPRIAMDSLGITFTRLYGIPNAGELLQRINHPGWWDSRLDSSFYYQAAALGYRAIGPLPSVSRVSYAARLLENYLAYDTAAVQAMPFQYKPSPAIATAARDTTVMHGLGWPVRIIQADSAGTPPFLVAGGPIGTAGRVFEIGDRGLYRAAGLPDRWMQYRVGMTIRADSVFRVIDPFPDNVLIAYILLYRRSRGGQAEDCKCAVYEPFDSIPVRAGDYRNADTTEQNFREVGKLVNFMRSAEQKRYDTVVIHRVKVYAGGVFTGAYADSLAHGSGALYSRDSLKLTFQAFPGCICIPARQDTVAHVAGYPEQFTIVRYDTVVRFHVQLYVPQGNEFALGYGKTYFGEADPACAATCATRFNGGEFPPGSVNEPVFESDFHMRIFSTGVVPITFLRTRVNQDLYDQLRAGALDGLVQKDIDSLYAPANALVNTVTGRMALQDEPIHQRLRAGGHMSRTLQRMMRAKGDTIRQTWQNPPGNFDGYRLLMEDFDSTNVKTVQNITRQDYHTLGGVGVYGDPSRPADRIPVFYANPDKMDSLMLYTLFRTRDSMPRVFQDSVFKRINGLTLERDTANNPILLTVRTYYDTAKRNRMIAFNTKADYDAYTAMRQAMFGAFADYRGLVSTNIGPLISQTARAVDVAKFKYARLGPPCPVWNMVQAGAWINVTDNPRHEHGGNWDMYWSLFRPPTPEEITAQLWLVLACGADGAIYTDAVWDGTQLGFMDAYNGDFHQEYDTLKIANRDIWSGDTLGYTFPKMWVGFNSRFKAMQRANREVRRIDSLIHFTRLTFRQEQMSVYDIRQSFAAFPLVDTLIARRVERYNLAGGYHDTAVIDTRDSTYFELSRFLPPGSNPATSALDTSYLMIVNRRTYPTDTLHYDSLAQAHGAAANGLGAIDVRRPLIRLKNTTAAFVDSFLVEKVGHEAEWAARRIAVDSLLPLDFLEPGWGTVYRVIPIRSAVSAKGVAWNNAVRSENPSSGTRQRSRLAVYERDSAVYLRVFDSAGAISREWLVSDTVDTQVVSAGGGAMRRRAYNIFPSVAVARSAGAAGADHDSLLTCMVVWERRNQSGQASVEAMHITGLPQVGGAFPAHYARKHILPARAFVGGNTWMGLHPAVVGIDSGWVIASAMPGSTGGVDVVALRDLPHDVADTIAAVDSARMVAWMPRWSLFPTRAWPADSICQFPTLAYCRNVSDIRVREGRFSTSPGADTPNVDAYQAVRLAYQQGKRSNSDWEIMYNTLGVRFPWLVDHWNGKTELWVGRTEWASNGVDGCNHTHPSIAVDATAVGLAFETESAARSITMRYRDPVSISVLAQPRLWRTTVYRWGDGFISPGGLGLRPYHYITPSLTLFPSLPASELLTRHEGALVWQWTNASTARRNRLMFYHFGNTGVDTTLPDGMDPTLTLTSNIGTTRADAYTAETVLRRGANSLAVSAARPAGGTAFYYPAYILNTATTPHRAFRQPLATGNSIVGRYTIQRWDKVLAPCVANPGVWVGIQFGTLSPQIDTVPVPVPTWPPVGPPPAFSVRPPVTVDSINQVGRVARTAVFRAGSSAAKVRRVVIGSDSLVAWLNTQPYDTAHSHAADIFFCMQIVRASDDVVLWTGDTLSARGLGADTLDDSVSVPIHVYAPADTAVYIRHTATATPWLDAMVNAGFSFSDDLPDADTTLAKYVARPQRAGGAGPASIAVAVVPNPVNAGEAELRFGVTEPGVARITVHDVAGNLVGEPAPRECSRAGYYTEPVDFSGLRNGVYIVEVRIGRLRGTARFTVMR